MTETSFGTIPIKRVDEKIYVFLVKLKSGDHWGFPKGHKEEGEEDREAAIRELKEETFLDIRQFLRDIPFTETYRITRDHNPIQKTVYYYLVEVKGVYEIQAGEILEGRFFSLDDAMKYLTYDNSKRVLQEAMQYIKDVSL